MRGSREQLELSARMLRERNIEIEARRQYMEIVLKNVSTGVITLDASGFVTTLNTSAEKMLNLNAADIVNRPIGVRALSLHPDKPREIGMMEPVGAEPWNPTSVW